MSKRFVQGFMLLLVLTVGAALTGASSLTAYFYDTNNFTGAKSYMQNYVDSTTVEQVGDQYVVTVDLKDAYADIITNFSVSQVTIEDEEEVLEPVTLTNISTHTNLGVYQYTVANDPSYSKGSLSYVRPTNNVTYTYPIYISYQ